MNRIASTIELIDRAIPRGKPLDWRWRVLIAPVDLYLAIMVGYFIFHLLAGWTLWPVALLSEFLHLLLIPSFAFVLVLLLARRWRRAAFAGFLAIMWLVLFGPMFLPKNIDSVDCDAQQQDCVELTVMTYNVGYGLANPDDLVRVLRTSDADIVGLQEVSPEQQEAIDAEMGEIYPYREFGGLPQSGLAVLSRYPITSAEYAPAESEHKPAYLHAWIRVGGSEISTFVFRLHPPRLGSYPERNWITGSYGYHTWRGIDTVASIAVKQEPAILLVDLNLTDQSKQYQIARHLGFVDAYRAGGWGMGLTFPARSQGYHTFPVNSRLLRIDYVFVSDDFRLGGAMTGQDGGSDHLPVKSVLVLPMTSLPPHELLH